MILLKKYQYKDGTYLPDTSQPTDADEFEINTKKYTPNGRRMKRLQWKLRLVRVWQESEASAE